MRISIQPTFYIIVLCALSMLSAKCGGQEAERVYLSGRDKDHTIPWKFMCTSGAKSGEWTEIPVPSHWEMHGFGELNYKKDVGAAREERGLYERRFNAAQDWGDKRVFLVFEGVMTDTSVRLNGKVVGPTHQGGFYRFQFELTELLKLGEENILEVEVAKHSANLSVNKAERTADYWVFGGIYRPVYLEIVPSSFIERIAIDANAEGVFVADVFVSAPEGQRDTLLVEAQVQSLDGEDVGPPFEAALRPDDSTEPTRISTTTPSPRQWTAETPHLYQIEVRLKQSDQVLHRCRQRFGFRTVEVRRGDGIYVNGRRVILKGVNRHSAWPDSGRCLSDAVHRLDIETIQAMNMNAVRMSHYPPDTEFLDLCDEMGLYVLDELAGWHWHYDTRVGRRLVKELVTRDVNHPSILFWDNGNEGGNNVALDEVFHQFDPQQRAVLHPWEAYKFINTAHYLTYDRAVAASLGAPTRHGPGEEYQEWEDLNDPNKYIYMPTEMLHGLYDGGGGAGLADYWRLMRQSPVLGGGFLWTLFDEGIRRPDGSIDCADNQAPDGIVGPYRQREASFYTIKELWSPIQVRQDNVGRIKIQNDYSFTDASKCMLTWQLRDFPGPEGQGVGFSILAEGRQELPQIPPGEVGELELSLPSQLHSAEAIAVRVEDPNGRELWTWVWPLQEASRDRYQRTRNGAPLSVQENADVLTVKSGGDRISFDQKTGLLKEVYCSGKSYSLANGPLATTGDCRLESLTHAARDGKVVIEAKYAGALRSVIWTVRGDGWVDCEYAYAAEGAYEYYGVTFDYPQDQVQGKRWLGDGPYRVWKNRLQGVSFGLWQNRFNDTITGYSGWEYPEFKGCFANVHWMQLDTTEGPITIVPHSSEAYVQVLTPSLPPKQWRGKTDYTLPECGLALLNAIPPIGSKFKPADSTGPMGQLNNSMGLQHGGVSFFFGEVDRGQ